MAEKRRMLSKHLLSVIGQKMQFMHLDAASCVEGLVPQEVCAFLGLFEVVGIQLQECQKDLLKNGSCQGERETACRARTPRMFSSALKPSVECLVGPLIIQFDTCLLLTCFEAEVPVISEVSNRAHLLSCLGCLVRVFTFF